ncbi:hypothetical protein HKX48_001648 [Thoreauomyces humboldtii]|nr:hypothetical protein HKX48_001648 [Thoreauomyces humboldtii]
MVPRLPEEIHLHITSHLDKSSQTSHLLARAWRLLSPTRRRYLLASLSLTRSLRIRPPTSYLESNDGLRKASVDVYVELAVGRYLFVRRIVDRVDGFARPKRRGATGGDVHVRIYRRRDDGGRKAQGGFGGGGPDGRTGYRFVERTTF